MPVSAPPTLTARAELRMLARALDLRPGLSPERRLALRTRALAVLEMIDAAEDAPSKLAGQQALAVVRAFAAAAAPDLLALAARRIAERRAAA